MFRNEGVICALCALGLIATSRVAGAEPVDRIRLSLDTTVLSYETVTLKVEATEAVAAEEVSLSRTGFALGGGGLGFGIGGGVSDNVILGARFAYGSATEEIEDGAGITVRSLSLQVLPEYVFDNDGVRPFVGLVAGLRSTTTESEGGTELTSSGIHGGFAVGMHAFLTDTFSLDPLATVFYDSASYGNDGDLTGSGIGFSVGIALSGWLGGLATPASGAGAGPEESVGPAAGPADEPPPRFATGPVDQPSTGALTVTVALAGGDRLVFTAKEGDKDVSLAFVVHGEVPECASMVVKTTKRSYEVGPLEATRLEGGAEQLIALRGTVGRAAVRAISRTRAPVVLEGCGKSWSLEYPEREGVRRFVAELKARDKEADEPAEAGEDQAPPAGAVEAPPAGAVEAPPAGAP